MSEIHFLLDFLKHLLRQKSLLVLAILFIGIDVGSELLIPIILKDFLDSPEKNLLSFSLVLIGVISTNAASRYFSIYLTNKVGQNILHSIRNNLFSHITKLKMRFFDKNQSGKLVIRVINDVENLNELFVSGLITFVADILIIFGIITIMFILNFKLALVSLAVFPFMIYTIVVFRKKASEIYLSIRKKISELNSFTAEAITGIKTVKIIPGYIFSSRKFRKLNEDYSNEVNRSIILYSFFFSSIIFFSSLSLAGVFLYGGIKILLEELTFGTFIAFWYAVNKLYDPVWDFSEKYNIFQVAVASAKRMKEILNEPEETANEEIQPAEYEKTNGRSNNGKFSISITTPQYNEMNWKIEFSDVHFSYDGNKEVLKGVSFTLEPREKVSIVGVTGAGKTTIANLLTRMYEPQKGKILLDGKDIREYPLNFIRKNICFVHQDIFILSGTVLENITFGQYDENKIDKIVKIMKAAEINIPLSREISEDGVGLSSGEKQIISILRAIYRDPRVIIFDEATAFVDIETERKISHILENILKDKTIIKIAHRISTALESDKIILIKDGKAHVFKKLKRKELINILGI